MNKKFLLIIGILTVGVLLFGCASKTTPIKESVTKKFSELKMQYTEKKDIGYNVTEVESLAKQAKEAYDKGDYTEADKLLDKAFTSLEMASTPTKAFIPSTSTPSTNPTQLNKDWLYDGPIYETHPYYYPNHSLKEITKQVPSLADFGIKTIWLMPIWEHQISSSPSTFIYLINDYYKIDPAYGTDKDLKELVETAHKYNIKILFDLVTCCTPPESVIWNNDWTLRIPVSDLQSMGLDLKYNNYQGNDIIYSNCNLQEKPVKCDLLGRPVGKDVIIYHYPFAGWGPAVDRSKAEVADYFTKVAEYYVREYDIDGWRIDSPVNNWNPNIIHGDHSIMGLLRNIEKTITDVKPSAILYAESPFVARLDAYQSINPSESPILDEISDASNSNLGLILNKLKTSDELVNFFINEKIGYNRARVRFIETVNEQRINKLSPQLNRPLIVLISTIPGVLLIQTGQEIGATNQFFSDNPSVDWNNGDYELRDFYKKVFKIHNENNALKYGSISNVWKSGDNTYAYQRSYKDEKVIVVINLLNKKATSSLDLSFIDKGTVLVDELSGESFTIDNPGNFQIYVPEYGARIFTRKG